MLRVALLDDQNRIVLQQESEPAGGKRPTSGWAADEFVEDGWKMRLPRDLPSGKSRLAVSLVDPVANQRIPTASGATWVDLPTSHWPMWSRPKELARIIGDVAKAHPGGAR